MGCTNPRYSSAILKSNNIFYFFDSHSCDRGHMQNENDSVHATDERASRNILSIYSTLQ